MTCSFPSDSLRFSGRILTLRLLFAGFALDCHRSAPHKNKGYVWLVRLQTPPRFHHEIVVGPAR